MLAARVGQWGLTLGSGLWLAALLLTPESLSALGSFVCHQRPERSFFISGHQIAVCARCLGLYAGSALAAPVALIAASSIASPRARWFAIAAAAPTAITWSLEFAGFVHFSRVVRFAAALPLGAVAAWLVMSVLSED